MFNDALIINVRKDEDPIVKAFKEGREGVMLDEKPSVSWEAEELIAELQKELAELRKAQEGTGPMTVVMRKEDKVGSSLKKNQKPGKPSATRRYVFLTDKLSTWGKVPQQQADIAEILTKAFEVGKEYTEAEVFAALIDGAGDYPSITRSVQDVTYLFRYYRGLKSTATHGSYISRNFLRMID